MTMMGRRIKISILLVAVLALVVIAIPKGRDMNIFGLFESHETKKKDIVIEVYLLTLQQVAAALSDPEADITQPPQRDLAGDNYVLLRVRHNGRASRVSGRLICKSVRNGIRNTFYVRAIRQDAWTYYVAPGGGQTPNTSDEIPAYTWEWKSFMVK